MTRLEPEGREGFLTKHHLAYAFLSDKKEKITEIGVSILQQSVDLIYCKYNQLSDL